ncbi:MAG: hypothetical protein MKZ95_16825, partial [Pirellulales bacterium]|nr:hypothetical protein [Pirellulales bacterium]
QAPQALSARVAEGLQDHIGSFCRAPCGPVAEGLHGHIWTFWWHQVLQWQNSVRALRDQLDLREELAVLGPAGPAQD